jgi:fluoroquinolone transport system ATP-binding protein
MTDTGSTMIQVRDLTYSYPKADRSAIQGLRFEVARGEIFGFLGPNGAGKSTTQKILIGLLQDYTGTVSALGTPLAEWGPDFYEHVGVAFEFPNHYLKLTGLENLKYFRALYSEGTQAPEWLLERVDLVDAADMPVSQYSKGMKSRLSIARALLNNPDLLFLDEPTTGLDPVSGRRIKELIREQRDAGTTVFLTTHDMVVADDLCDRVAFILNGEIQIIDAPRDLKLRHGSRRVRVEYVEGKRTKNREFPLGGVGDNPEFLQLVRGSEIETIHTLEATLEDIFVEVTGSRLL